MARDKSEVVLLVSRMAAVAGVSGQLRERGNRRQIERAPRSGRQVMRAGISYLLIGLKTDYMRFPTPAAACSNNVQEHAAICASREPASGCWCQADLRLV
jgi:hypothetical protein